MVLRGTIACFGAAFFLSSATFAEERVGLVIGNSAYQHTAKLMNPRNDASDMAAALKKHGFHVIEGFDLDKATFDRKVRDFAVALKGAEAGLFFYAGHGLQVAGQNYLVPVDARAEGAEALEFELMRLDVIHRIMERQTNTNILFLDACRDNPLARNLARSMGTRSSEVGHGLAAVESGIGTLISFSTQPGNVALDGSGRNSPFAGALSKLVSTSDDDLSAMLIAVRNDVMRATQRKQVPWEHSALTGKFYFNATSKEKPTGSSPVPRHQSEAAQAWGTVKDTTDPSVLDAFIKQFDETVYGTLARARSKELVRQQVATAKPDCIQEKDSNLAIRGCTELIRQNPNDANAYSNRGLAHQRDGDYAQAMADFNKAVELNPKLAAAYNNRGFAYASRKEYDLAFTEYNKAVEIDPKSARAHLNRGFAYASRKEYDLAIADYNKAVEIDPKFARVYNNRGVAYHFKGERNRAIADYTKAIKISPNDAMAYNNRGFTYEALGRKKEAVADYRKALSRDPSLQTSKDGLVRLGSPP